jgi:hypothetical protein
MGRLYTSKRKEGNFKIDVLTHAIDSRRCSSRTALGRGFSTLKAIAASADAQLLPTEDMRV